MFDQLIRKREISGRAGLEKVYSINWMSPTEVHSETRPTSKVAF